MRKGKTQQQICLEYINMYGRCTVGGLNTYANCNYSHNYISKFIKAGILSAEPEKCKSLSGKHFYTWYANNIDWGRVDMQKCVLR